jgi:GNAT superfamily N-acetyltransferase
MRCSIGAAQRADIPRLVELLRTLFGTEADFAADAARQQRGLELLLAAAAQGDRVTVAVARDEDGIVIGMASAQLVISTAEGALSAWIEDVVVDAQFRRLGVGRRLLDHLLTWAQARGATRAQLVTDTENAGARFFYDGLAWQGTQLTVRRRVLD